MYTSPVINKLGFTPQNHQAFSVWWLLFNELIRIGNPPNLKNLK